METKAHLLKKLAEKREDIRFVKSEMRRMEEELSSLINEREYILDIKVLADTLDNVGLS